MDTLSVAHQASALGVMPLRYVKSVLASGAINPLLPPGKEICSVYEPDLLRALLYEALLFLLRSMSHLVAYEAAVTKGQFSWATVTLYYANYFSVLSLNRLAGEAVSTLPHGSTYQVVWQATPSLFQIQRSDINNHKMVWNANFRLYAHFNWRDTTLDGHIVKVPLAQHGNHPERKIREYINYHPESYQEILTNSKRHKQVRQFCGKYYTVVPDDIPVLPITDPFERDIATLESHAIARQMLLLGIFDEIIAGWTTFPGSRLQVQDMFSQFRRNYLTHTPFNLKLKTRYEAALAKVIR